MRKQTQLAPKWVALIAGLVFAVPGLWLVVDSLPKFEEFAVRQRAEIQNRSSDQATPLPNGKYLVIISGFDAGGGALFGFGVFAVGTGLATCRFLEVEGRRRLSLLLALLWHALGITTGVWFWNLAPRPLSFGPLLTIGLYEWLGMIPLALGVSKERLNSRLNSALGMGWIGTIPGAAVGGLVGYAVDLVQFMILKRPLLTDFVGPYWMVGLLLGGLVTGIGFLAYGVFYKKPITDSHMSVPTDHQRPSQIETVAGENKL